MTRILTFVLLIGTCVLIGGHFFFGWGRTLQSHRVTIHGISWIVELARTEEEHKQGLGLRDALSPQSGMLFVFPTPGRYGFWMDEMRFPLDIVFIREGRILSIERHVSLNDRHIMQPLVPVNFVLEMNAGEADALSVDMGVEGLP